MFSYPYFNILFIHDFSKKAMACTDEHNEVLIREMFLFQPWNYKKGSQQPGHAWEMISDSLK